MFEFAYTGGPAARPREFDHIYRIGGDQPHFNYPLRNVPEDAFKVVHRRSSGPVSSPADVARLTVQQAIREAFPGAIYLHMAKGWRVYEWRSTSFEKAIRVSPTKSLTPPQPLIRTFVNFSLERDGIVEGRYRSGERGFLAECHLQINERVEGFREAGEPKYYKDLRNEKPWMTSKTRDFRTTGVVMRVEENWFRQRGVKQLVVDGLRDLMLREYSISPQDVTAVATNISLIRNGQREAVSDVVVLFDETYGSLRLTELVYLRLNELLNQLERSVRVMPPDDDRISRNIVVSLGTWLDHLGKEEDAEPGIARLDDGNDWLQVYEVGSVVARKDAQGVLHDMEITGHEYSAINDQIQLFYLYKTNRPIKAMVSADFVEAIGDEWSTVYLNRATGEKRESLDDEEE